MTRLAVWRRNLHETGFPAAAGGAGVTGRLLHGEGCKHDGVDVEFGSVLLELVNVVGTGGEHVRGIEFGGDELVDADLWRSPAGTVNATV